MVNNNPIISFNELLQQSIDVTGLSVSQFSSQSGIDLPDRFYRALKPNGVKLSLDTLHSVSSKFPDLNMDRFIRFSGPVLLSELRGHSTPSATNIQNSSKTEEYYQAVIDGKNNEIAQLERRVAFMEKMLDK